MGFPIRKSSDQRVFAPPRRLSQRITSFIACACQGIHQMPLRHLIILIANIHLLRPHARTSLAGPVLREARHTTRRPSGLYGHQLSSVAKRSLPYKPASFMVQQLKFSRYLRWVAPFGDPWIKAHSQLPTAYRSVSRPSSPVHAKASTKCPYDT